MIFHIPTIDIMITGLCNLRCKYCFEEEKCKPSLDFKDFKKYIDEDGVMDYFLFGGEPFVNVKFLKDLFHYYDERKDIPQPIKNKMGLSSKHIITNGTLISKNAEFIRDNDLRLQLSLDGPKEINDLNRIDVMGKGVYDTVMKNLKYMIDFYGIEKTLDYTFHGVVNRETLKYYADITNWHIDMMLEMFEYKKSHGEQIDPIRSTINMLRKNTYMIIFEEDYTDEDIDTVIEQLFIFSNDIMKDERFTLTQRKGILNSVMNGVGGVCGAGASLIAVDSSLDFFPCHRCADGAPETKVGNIYDCENVKGYKLMNCFYDMNSVGRTQYGAYYINHGYNNNLKGFMWCPSTNLETSKNPYYVNSKYVILMLEWDRATKVIIQKYNLRDVKNDNRNRQQNNSC